ncbi:hypothetical protein MIR68_006643 [Amoeboaphelidium protococcarum]|nr:hypothetical protein MIR68_006643 [Amoeboaphelidium protococcarum]
MRKPSFQLIFLFLLPLQCWSMDRLLRGLSRLSQSHNSQTASNNQRFQTQPGGLKNHLDTILRVGGHIIMLADQNDDQSISKIRQALAELDVNSGVSSARQTLLNFVQEEFPEQSQVILQCVQFVGDFQEDIAVMRSTVQSMFGKIDHFVRNLKLSKLANIDKILSGQNGMDLNSFPEAWRRGMPVLIENYIDNIHGRIKRRMVGQVLVRGLDFSNKVKMIVSTVIGAGLGFQKMFQMIADKVTNEQLKESLEELKSSIPPMATWDYRQVMTEVFGPTGDPLQDSIFEEFDHRPIAAGTVGQVHRAKLKANSPQAQRLGIRDVAVKLMRVGLVEDLHHEFELYANVLQEDHPLVYKTLLETRADLEKELDFANEKQNLIEGHRRYTQNNKNIKIPRFVELFETDNPQLRHPILVVEWAPGVGLEQAWKTYQGQADPERRAQFLDWYSLKLPAVYQRYEAVALFKHGFYHGDLHRGNFKIQMDSDDPREWVLWIIDFGNAGKLTDNERYTLLTLGWSVMRFSIDGVVKTLMRSACETQVDGLYQQQQWDQFSNLVESRFQEAKQQLQTMNREEAVNFKFTLVSSVADDAFAVPVPLPAGVTNYYRDLMGLMMEMDRLRDEMSDCHLCNQQAPQVSKLSIATAKRNLPVYLAKFGLNKVGSFCRIF